MGCVSAKNSGGKKQPPLPHAPLPAPIKQPPAPVEPQPSVPVEPPKPPAPVEPQPPALIKPQKPPAPVEPQPPAPIKQPPPVPVEPQKPPAPIKQPPPAPVEPPKSPSTSFLISPRKGSPSTAVFIQPGFVVTVSEQIAEDCTAANLEAALKPEKGFFSLEKLKVVFVATDVRGIAVKVACREVKAGD